MIRICTIAAAVGAIAMMALVGPVTPAAAQNAKPSAAAIETAREVIQLKGGYNIFDALIPGVIEQDKTMFLQQNPALQKDLDAVAAQLRTEFAPRMKQLMTEIAELYAAHFTEQEIKEILAFYKSPVGRKMIAEEPKALDQSMSHAQSWAVKISDQVLVRMREEMKKKGHDL